MSALSTLKSKDIETVAGDFTPSQTAELRPPAINITTNFDITSNLTVEIEIMTTVTKQEEYMELPDASAKKAYLIGQMDGNMLNLRLTRAVQSSKPINLEQMLPDIRNKSMHYKKGLKSFVLSKTFPLALQLFHDSPRTRQERIEFMNAMLDQLR